MDCCHDTEEHFEVDNYQLVAFEFEFDHKVSFLLPISFLEVDVIAEEQIPLKKLPYYQYSPPLIASDLPVLYDTFLI